jgi:hypothetical protein
MSSQPPLYNPNAPQSPSETLDDSGREFQVNFSKLAENFLKNHVELESALSQGNHTIIELLEQPPNSGIQTDLAEISVYAQNVPDQTDQIFLEYQGNGQEFQYTNYQLYKPEDSPFQDKYFTFLPGRILLYFGVIRPTKDATLLDLSPYISRNIMSISLCPIGTTPLFKPSVKLPEKQNGFYHGITLVPINRPPVGIIGPVSGVVPACYYMVMANV